MNTLLTPQTRGVSRAQKITAVDSRETAELLRLGDAQRWGTLVLGRAPIPDRPVRVRDWLIAPVEQDSSVIPPRTLERVQAIYAAGLRPQGFVLVHEAPPLLSAPTTARPEAASIGSLISQLRATVTLTEETRDTLVVGLKRFAQVVATIVLASASLLAMSAVTLDPILVAVTEDEYWVEIDRWWN